MIDNLGGSDIGDNHLGRFLMALQFDKPTPPRLVHRIDKVRFSTAIFSECFKHAHEGI